VTGTTFQEELKDKKKLANRETLLKAKDGAPDTFVRSGGILMKGICSNHRLYVRHPEKKL
jgi:hypothetical protein